jgi:hypothetical protein
LLWLIGRLAAPPTTTVGSAAAGTTAGYAHAPMSAPAAVAASVTTAGTASGALSGKTQGSTASRAQTGSTSGGVAVTAHPIIDQAVDAMTAVGGYEFRHLNDIRAFSGGAPGLLSGLAVAFDGIARSVAETPASGVADMYAHIAAGLQGLANASEEITAALEGYNADDFERIDNPRPNEQMADYEPNAAG